MSNLAAVARAGGTWGCTNLEPWCYCPCIWCQYDHV